MKKTILAVVTSTLFAASAQAATIYDKDGSSIDLTGRIQYEAGQYGSTAGKADNFGGDSLARFGFAGKWATGTDVNLIGKLEWEVSSEHDQATDDNQIDARYAFAGADFGNGVQATVGTQDSAFVQLGNVTDIFNEYSGTVEYALGSTTASGAIGGDTRWDDSAKVAYIADGWDLESSVAFNDAAKTDTAATIQERYAVSAGYTYKIDDISSVKTVVGYEAQAGDFGTIGDYTNSQYAAGIGYTYDAFYIGTTYGQAKYETDSNKKNTIWAVSAAYQFVPGWTATAGYALADGHNYTGEIEKYYVVGLEYAITPNAKAFTGYKINQIPAQDDNYYVGLQYNF